MPQLDPTHWGPQLIWLVLTFSILYLLMKYVALPRIGGVIEIRQGRIRGDLEAADRLRSETQEAIAAYEQALAEARAKAHAIAEEGRAKLNAEMAAERATLERELGARQAEAEKRIQAAKSDALSEVKNVAAEAASEIVRRLIGAAPSQAEVASAIAETRKE